MQTATVISLPIGAVRLNACASSVVGSVRKVNEDSFIADAPLFVVADGMGGHERGDRASQTVVGVLASMLPAGSIPTSAQVLAAITAANDAVRDLTGDDGHHLNSGTTLVGLALVQAEAGANAHWMAFNVGDSRIYRWDGRELDQLSVDHSAVQELIDAGVLTDAAARVHPERNIITRAVGAADEVDADVWLLPVGGAQTFLICSDGLTKELDDAEIADLLAEHGSDGGSRTVAEALVDAANLAGGNDNITVVVLDSSVDGATQGDESTNENTLGSAPVEDTRPRALG